jgi:hypothetical protein
MKFYLLLIIFTCLVSLVLNLSAVELLYARPFSAKLNKEKAIITFNENDLTISLTIDNLLPNYLPGLGSKLIEQVADRTFYRIPYTLIYYAMLHGNDITLETIYPDMPIVLQNSNINEVDILKNAFINFGQGYVLQLLQQTMDVPLNHIKIINNKSPARIVKIENCSLLHIDQYKLIFNECKDFVKDFKKYFGVLGVYSPYQVINLKANRIVKQIKVKENSNHVTIKIHISNYGIAKKKDIEFHFKDENFADYIRDNVYKIMPKHS